MGFNKISLIITIVLFSYCICGFVFLLVVRIVNKRKMKKQIKLEENKPFIKEVALYENQETIN